MRIAVIMIFLANTAAIAGEMSVGFEVYNGGKVIVSKVYELTDAATQQVAAGDVVLSVGGRDVKTAGQFKQFVAQKKIGNKVRVKLFDGQKSRTVVLIVGDGDDMKANHEAFAKAGADATKRRLDSEAKQVAEDANKRRKRAEEIAKIDPELFPMIERLEAEYEIIKDSNAHRLQKAAHCDRIASCYLKIQDEVNFRKWTDMASLWRTTFPPSIGSFNVR